VSKYNGLREEPSENSFTGVKFTDYYAGAVPTKDGVAFISGFPACPECGKALDCLFLEDMWHCSGCDTRWSNLSLIEALRDERAVAKLYKEATEEEQ